MKSFFEIAKAIAEETGTIESRRDLSISYNRLGDISESQGKLEEAKDYYEKTLEIVNELCERCPLVKKYDRWRYLLKRALGELN